MKIILNEKQSRKMIECLLPSLIRLAKKEQMKQRELNKKATPPETE